MSAEQLYVPRVDTYNINPLLRLDPFHWVLEETSQKTDDMLMVWINWFDSVGRGYEINRRVTQQGRIQGSADDISAYNYFLRTARNASRVFPEINQYSEPQLLSSLKKSLGALMTQNSQQAYRFEAPNNTDKTITQYILSEIQYRVFSDRMNQEPQLDDDEDD